MDIHIATKAGSICFALWGLIHVIIPISVFHNFKTKGLLGVLQYFSGGPKNPTPSVSAPERAPQKEFTSALLKTFICNVGGAGIVSLALAYKLWTEADLFVFVVGLVVTGIAEWAFMYFVFHRGVTDMKGEIALNLVLWVAGAVLTPIGLYLQYAA
ncbi:hypothetical protein BCR33DRAFT_721643 [Rhizoclosmatium globosum]|uniref:DUF1761-domain-containing protein n=1 Tax=Rhizoclosmatium globosum TaxID=329046 RepID=A0A1Y2BRD9_9FUNG|nr:hypothetical protein BCR33DRAFT_721643 [Rhizoclosmatium globosum]|eukprot:ORY37294.1 hypothetical protein BCR33DRAFT_721643 [Rhizoclosmatium globosum]